MALVSVRCSICRNVVDWDMIVKVNPPICKLCFQSRKVFGNIPKDSEIEDDKLFGNKRNIRRNKK